MDEIQESLQQAQSFFNEHAMDECEVILRKVATVEYTPADGASQSGTEATDSQSTVD